jgi:hypothetical protein
LGAVAGWETKARNAIREEIRKEFPSYRSDSETKRMMLKDYWNAGNERCQQVEEKVQ